MYSRVQCSKKYFLPQKVACKGRLIALLLYALCGGCSLSLFKPPTAQKHHHFCERNNKKYKTKLQQIDRHTKQSKGSFVSALLVVSIIVTEASVQEDLHQTEHKRESAALGIQRFFQHIFSIVGISNPLKKLKPHTNKQARTQLTFTHKKYIFISLFISEQ